MPGAGCQWGQVRHDVKMILVTGGTGFVGRAVVRELVRQGLSVRVLARQPERPSARQLVRETGCACWAGDILDPRSLDAALKGVEAVIHLVGIIRESGRQTFMRVHGEGTHHVVEACRRAGVSRLVHMSASGTRPYAPAPYHRGKWAGECAVRASGLDWTIFRPAVIYGPGDGFCRLLALPMRPPLRWLSGGMVPMVGEGTTRVQPVRVEEVAEMFVRALQHPVAIGGTYELGGVPISFRQLLLELGAAYGVRVYPVPVPREMVYAAAWLVEVLSPWKIPTPGHVMMLEEDQQADTSPAQRDLGFAPLSFAEGLSRMIRAG